MGGSDALKDPGRDTEQDLNATFEDGIRLKLDRWWRNSRLCIYTVLLLVSSVGNSLYFKRQTSAMPNYCWYLTQLPMVFYTPFFGFLAGKGALEQAKPMALRRFMVMGAGDGLASILMILGGSRTSGNLQVMLQQGVIPLSVVFSMTLLRTRFHLLQYLGALVIVTGIFYASTFQSESQGGEARVENDPVFVSIFCLAMVPMAASSVFKEVAFRNFGDDLDVNVVQFWVCVFQACVSFSSMPIYSLKVLGTQQVPVAAMGNLTKFGTRCLFMLEDHVVTDCGGLDQRPCDHCQDAWFFVFAYMLFNIIFNIYTMLVIKHGSATLSFLVTTLRMPLSSLAFSSTWIMGKDAVQLSFSDLITLVVIILGLVFYRVGGHLEKRRLEREKSPALRSPSVWLLSPNGADAKDNRRRNWRFVPFVMTGAVPMAQPVFLFLPDKKLAPRSPDRIRSDLYRRLGAASPLHSPSLRHMSPRNTPSSSGVRSPVDSPRKSPEMFLSRMADPQKADFSMSGLKDSPSL